MCVFLEIFSDVMRFLKRFSWQSKFAIPRTNWEAFVLVMIKKGNSTKFVRLVTETGQNCMTEIPFIRFHIEKFSFIKVTCSDHLKTLGNWWFPSHCSS